MKKLQKGFTLIELMIVVAIIAILAAVAAPKFGAQIRKAKDAKALAVVGNWRSALGLGYSDNEVYETTFSTTLTALVDKGTLGATTISGATATTPVGTVGTATSNVTVAYEVTGSAVTASVDITTTGTDTKGTAWNKY